MLRFGKQHDQRYGDKIARSNRGRARASAAITGRKHLNLGYRRSQAQLVEMRAAKKRARLEARLSIEGDMFDLELARYDPEIWLHGTDLAAFKDTVTTHTHCGYPGSFAADPYAYCPDDDDWDWEEAACREDDEAAYRYQYDLGDYDFERFDDNSDPGPEDIEPLDVTWRDLWVAGHAHDPDGRDLPDEHARGYAHHYWDCGDDYDLENPLLVREDPVLPFTMEAVVERDLERHRAGERYFRQTGRTVQKPRDVVVKTHRRVA